MKHFIDNNKYKERYNNNNDCYIHVRLGDMERWNPGFKYYDSVLSKIKCENIYISTNDNNHSIIKQIKNKYGNVKIMNDDLHDIFQFGSTCRYVILSYGTFSALMGYLAFYSTVYCLKHSIKYAWDWNLADTCNMFTNKATKIEKWINIDI